MTTQTYAEFSAPSEFRVIVQIPADKARGIDKPFNGRVGDAKTIEGARKLIDDDLKAMGDTLGGLIEPVSVKGRRYRIFKSKGWTELT